jgi:hypothetical protein
MRNGDSSKTSSLIGNKKLNQTKARVRVFFPNRSDSTAHYGIIIHPGNQVIAISLGWQSKD